VTVVHGAPLYASGDGEFWNADHPGEFQAIRAAADADLNITINDASSHTGAQTILWDWVNATHQQWALTSIYDARGPKDQLVHVVAGGPPHLAEVDGKVRVGNMTVEKWTEAQVRFHMLTFGDLLAFRNVGSGKYIAYQGVGQPVTLVDSPTTEALWTRISDAYPWGYLRPWLNPNANLKFDRNSLLVGVWNWAGPENTAKWWLNPVVPGSEEDSRSSA